MGKPKNVSNPARLAKELADAARRHGETTRDKTVALADLELILSLALEELDEDGRRNVLENLADDGCLEEEWED